jgi:hypothetical protein
MEKYGAPQPIFETIGNYFKPKLSVSCFLKSFFKGIKPFRLKKHKTLRDF